MKTLFFILALFTVPAFAQIEALPAADADLLAKVWLFELEAEACVIKNAGTEKCKNINSELAAIYAQVAKSPRVIRHLAAQAVAKYQKMEPSVKSAPQASQIADQQNAKLIPLLVIQNQRIIELLEAILKKPR